MYNPFSLAGKTILVTGASSGIGMTTAISCAKAGANVVVTARKEEALQKLPAIIQKGDVVLVKASHSMEFEKIVDELKKLK